jgi:hypothetical protein
VSERPPSRKSQNYQITLLEYCNERGESTNVKHLPAGETNVADRGRASGLYRVGITGTESHASPLTKWSKIRDCNGDFKVLNGHEQCRSKGIECVKWK